MWDIDESLYQRYRYICGVDEVGRGPLAGDVYAAAVILPRGLEIKGLNDSKKLSEKRREELFDVIAAEAVAYAVATASIAEIESLNIKNAALLAMDRAISLLTVTADYALVDGDTVKGISIPCEAVVKGDTLYSCIAAASVMAKVFRDRYMRELACEYPDYGFERHKGYGTARHIEAIKQYGPSPVHRPYFIKKFI